MAGLKLNVMLVIVQVIYHFKFNIMKTKKRTLLKTIWLLIYRYHKWESNAKNIEKICMMRLYNNQNYY